MRVIVDTSVWSLALRRRRVNAPEASTLWDLIREDRVQLLGPIRQEILTGIREEAQFDRVNQRLSLFPDLAIETSDYVRAAHFTNMCQRKGIQGFTTDLLLCACAVERSMSIFTTDKDFERFAQVLPIDLYAETRPS